MRSSSPPDIDTAASEGIDPSPASRNVEQLEMTDAAREHGIDDEMLPVRLEAEHRPQQQQGRSRRPRLRAARGRVLHRILRLRALVSPECLGKATVEELGCLEDAVCDLRGFLLEAVPPETPGDEGVVEGPH